MIRLIEAPPRSGKSFFAVNYLVRLTQYDELYQEFILSPQVLIISNIEGLKINHWSLDACLASRIKDKELSEKCKSLEFKKWPLTDVQKNEVLVDFFEIENFERIMSKTGKNHIILCIDEVHDYFPSGYYNQSIYSFFAYHGHIGLDVILMCQSLTATSRMFNPLLEFVMKVTPRSKSVLNNFSYSFYDLKGKFLYSQSLPKKQLVFKAYKSFRHDEQVKPKNAIKHWFIIIGVLVVASGLCFKTALAIVKGKSDSAQKKSEQMAAEAKQKKLAASVSAPLSVPVVAPTVPSVSPSPSSPAAPVSVTAPAPVPLPVVPPAPANVASVSVITVKGYIKGSSPKLYLLSDGRIAPSQNNYYVGQFFPE